MIQFKLEIFFNESFRFWDTREIRKMFKNQFFKVFFINSTSYDLLHYIIINFFKETICI